MRFDRQSTRRRDGQPRPRPRLACSMIVPFSVNDFLDRALAVYGDRIGIPDEPTSPPPSSAT